MSKEMNILVLSCGTRNKIIQYFKKELGDKGKVFATDSSELAPALYDADEYFIVPRITDPGYLQHIIDICKENNIIQINSEDDPYAVMEADDYCDRYDCDDDIFEDDDQLVYVDKLGVAHPLNIVKHIHERF